MSFPLVVKSAVNVNGTSQEHPLILHRGYTVMLGPNGSGKTHLLRGLKSGLQAHSAEKKVRFLSAGRMGLFEQYRSDFDGQRGGQPNYENARYGGVKDTHRRHQVETLQGDFQTIAVRPDIQVKLRERLRKLFKRDISIEWDSGSLKIDFISSSGGKAYSSAREASGLVHLSGLLAALYDDDVGALLIDEPEISLHPQLQAFLLREFLRVAGLPQVGSYKKLVIVASHSTEFLDIQSSHDLPSIVFCRSLLEAPLQIDASAGELQNTKLSALIARMGQEHKLAFFSRTPLLVEGPSDAIICSALASKCELNLEAGGSQILPVIGKGQIPIVVKLLRLVGKTPIVLSDADGLADGVELANTFLVNPDANDLAAKAGFKSATEMSNSVYRDYCALVESRWNEIASVGEKHPYWAAREAGTEESKAKRRAAMCVVLSAPDADLQALAQDGAWRTIKTRLSATLDLLEEQGCFFLRKGTIEAYYQAAPSVPGSGKPSAAADEAFAFRSMDEYIILDAYADIVRCLRKASDAENINEAESLQDVVLAVAALALGRFKLGVKGDDLNALARSVVGKQADLFDLSVRDGQLIIELKSFVLDVRGFPLSVGAEDDVVKVVSKALGLMGPKAAA